MSEENKNSILKCVSNVSLIGIKSFVAIICCPVSICIKIIVICISPLMFVSEFIITNNITGTKSFLNYVSNLERIIYNSYVDKENKVEVIKFFL